MTEITPEALEALSKKALDARKAYDAHPDHDTLCALLEHEKRFGYALADLYRTGQLILAQPSGPERYPLRACIWKRQPYDGCPQGEWVLEIEGQINDMSFVSRHTEPLTTPPEEVPGLPSLYASQPSGDEVEAVKAAILPALWSPASGPVVWDDQKRAATEQQAERMATAAITALDAVRGKQ